MAEKLETPKLDLKETIISSSVFSGASTAKITPNISFGGLSKVIGTQPSLLDAPKLDVPKSNPLADIVAQLQVKFESLSSRVRANVRDIRGLKKTVETEKGLSSAKEDTLIETNRILVEIQNQLALDFANRITEKKEKLDLIKESILKKRVADEEADLEKVDKKAKDTKKKTDKVIKPVQSIFDKILEFFTLLGGGLIASTGFEWLTDPANADKIAGVFKWLTENWNWIVGATAIAGAIVTIGTLGLALVGIWKILAGIGTVISAIAPFAIPIAVIMLSGFGFNWLLDRIIDYYNDPEHPERNFVGDLVPGAPPDALAGDYFQDHNGKWWVKYDFDSSNGGWRGPLDNPPDPERSQLFNKSFGTRIGRELEAVPIDEFDTGGRVLPYEFFIRDDSNDSYQGLFEVLSGMNPSINIANSFGGPLIGPSHEDGGIPIIVEGGEYIVRKSEVNPWSERFLNDFNNNGSLLWTRFDEINELMGDNHSEYQKLISGFSESISSLDSDFSYISPFTIPVEEEDNRNWLQKFWDWFVPPAHLSAEPSVRAGVRTPFTGFSHVESMSGGSQLFGAPPEENSSPLSRLGIEYEYDGSPSPFEFNAFRKDGSRINFSEFTFQGSEILIPSENTGTQTIERPSGSSGRIDIDPFDASNAWRNKTFDIYGIGGELNDATATA